MQDQNSNYQDLFAESSLSNMDYLTVQELTVNNAIITNSSTVWTDLPTDGSTIQFQSNQLSVANNGIRTAQLYSDLTISNLNVSNLTAQHLTANTFLVENLNVNNITIQGDMCVNTIKTTSGNNIGISGNLHPTNGLYDCGGEYNRWKEINCSELFAYQGIGTSLLEATRIGYVETIENDYQNIEITATCSFNNVIDGTCKTAEFSLSSDIAYDAIQSDRLTTPRQISVQGNAGVYFSGTSDIILPFVGASTSSTYADMAGALKSGATCGNLYPSETYWSLGSTDFRWQNIVANVINCFQCFTSTIGASGGWIDYFTSTDASIGNTRTDTFTAQTATIDTITIDEATIDESYIYHLNNFSLTADTVAVDTLKAFNNTNITLNNSILPSSDNSINIGNENNRISKVFTREITTKNTEPIYINTNASWSATSPSVWVFNKPYCIFTIASGSLSQNTWHKRNFGNGNPKTELFTLSSGTITCQKTGLYMFCYDVDYAFMTSGVDIWCQIYENGGGVSKFRSQEKASGLNAVTCLSKCVFASIASGYTYDFQTRHQNSSSVQFNGGFLYIYFFDYFN